jgi:hypothetical protein
MHIHCVCIVWLYPYLVQDDTTASLADSRALAQLQEHRLAAAAAELARIKVLCCYFNFDVDFYYY